MLGGLFGGDRVLKVASPEPVWGHALVEPRWEGLARRLHDRARVAPSSYRREVLLAAMLGTLVIVLAVLAIVTLAAGIVLFMVSTRHVNVLILQFLVFLALIGWSMAAALRVRFPVPPGRPVTADEAPRLFEAIEQVRAASGEPRLKAIHLTDDFNAAIVQRPRLGMLGWYENYLLVGLPLMRALSPAEFEAVVAHEFGHLAGQHGRTSAKVYRTRLHWLQLSERIGDGVVARLLRRFFRWYGPWFAAYSFALARAQEYEADRISAHVRGARVAADALLRVAEGAHAFQGLWRNVWKQSISADEPASRPFADAAHLLAQPDMANGPSPIEAALRETTGYSDTHPSLTDRLKALGEPPAPLQPVAETAAARLLGPFEATLAAAFDAEWWEAASEHFREAHLAHRAALEELAALRAEDAASLDEDRSWRLVSLVAEYDGEDAAIPLYRAFAERFPHLAGAPAVLARILLERDDPAGIAEAERAITINPETESHMAALVVEHLERTGADPAKWRARLDAANARDIEAIDERNAIRSSDQFTPPSLDRATFLRLAEVVASVAPVRAAWIARRTLEKSADPQHVIVLTVRRAEDAGVAINEVAARTGEFGEIIVAAASGGSNGWLLKRIREVSPEPLVHS